MSFNVLISRPHAYVLGVSDLGKYQYGSDGANEDARLVVDKLSGWKKATPLSAYTLCLGGANAALLDEFHSAMRERLDLEDADFEDCYASAREVVAEMRENTVERPDVPTWYSTENGGLAFMLAGFRADGNAVIAGWSAGGDYEALRDVDEDGWETLDVEPTGALTVTAPHGVPLESLLPFYELEEAPPSCADALRHAYTHWSDLYDKHPDRITSEMCGWILLWSAEGPRAIAFECDTNDVDDFARLYVKLQMLNTLTAATASGAA